MTSLISSDLADLGLPIRLPRPVLLNSGKEVSQRSVKPRIVSEPLNARFVSLTGRAAQEFVFLTRLFEFEYVYDQYLAYIKSCPDLGIMTGGELFSYWSKDRVHADNLVPR